MKKVIIFLICFFAFSISALASSSFVVMDADTGVVLSGSNIHEKKLIASITKVMTGYLSVADLNLNDDVKVDNTILDSYGSSIYLSVGEIIKVKDLIYGLLLRSGNDAALMLAKYHSSSVDEFVKKMNYIASRLNMNDTNFENPTGLDEYTKNISSAYDMALLTKYAIKNKTFKKIFGTKNYKFKSSTKSYNLTNKNKALFMSKYVTGGKTGYTKKARRTLITTASKDNINLIIVTLNVSNDFQFHVDKYNEIFSTYDKYLIINKNNLDINEKYYKKKYKYSFYTKSNYFITEKKDNLKNYHKEITIYKKKKVKNNDIVGSIKVYKSNELIYETPIYINLLGSYL